jgi:hypothetical protein
MSTWEERCGFQHNTVPCDASNREHDGDLQPEPSEAWPIEEKRGDATQGRQELAHIAALRMRNMRATRKRQEKNANHAIILHGMPHTFIDSLPKRATSNAHTRIVIRRTDNFSPFQSLHD